MAPPKPSPDPVNSVLAHTVDSGQLSMGEGRREYLSNLPLCQLGHSVFLSLGGIVSSLGEHVLGIFFGCSKEEMSGIHAQTNIAGMKNEKSWVCFPSVGKLPTHTVRPSVRVPGSAHTNGSISVIRTPSQPKPTFVSLSHSNLLPESLCEGSPFRLSFVPCMHMTQNRST